MRRFWTIAFLCLAILAMTALARANECTDPAPGRPDYPNVVVHIPAGAVRIDGGAQGPFDIMAGAAQFCGNPSYSLSRTTASPELIHAVAEAIRLTTDVGGIESLRRAKKITASEALLLWAVLQGSLDLENWRIAGPVTMDLLAPEDPRAFRSCPTLTNRLLGVVADPICKVLATFILKTAPRTLDVQPGPVVDTAQFWALYNVLACGRGLPIRSGPARSCQG